MLYNVKETTNPASIKACAVCGEDKPATDFLPSQFTDDGRTDTCKVCTFANAERDHRD